MDPGGLVARYLATLLLPELKQRNIELINFITVASPAVGIPLYVGPLKVSTSKVPLTMATCRTLSRALSSVRLVQDSSRVQESSCTPKINGPTPASRYWKT